MHRLVLACALVLSACSGGQDSPESRPVPAAAAPAATNAAPPPPPAAAAPAPAAPTSAAPTPAAAAPVAAAAPATGKPDAPSPAAAPTPAAKAPAAAAGPDTLRVTPRLKGCTKVACHRPCCGNCMYGEWAPRSEPLSETKLELSGKPVPAPKISPCGPEFDLLLRGTREGNRFVVQDFDRLPLGRPKPPKRPSGLSSVH